MRRAIFIDGGYLDTVLLEFKRAKIKYEELCSELSEDTPLLRTYYYHCLPYKSPTPTDAESISYANALKFQTRLSQLPSFSIRRGKLAHRGIDKETGKPIYEQKRVDVALATDLVMHSTKRLITHATIITGDSDFIPAVEIAQSEGVEITLCYSESCKPHDELLGIVDKRFCLTEAFINKIKRGS